MPTSLSSTGLKGAAARVARTFGSFTPGQKAVSILAVVALVAGGLFFTQWAAKPTYATLYSGLAPADASAIVDELTAAGTPYQLADAGTILVPKESLYPTRVMLSGKSLPAGDATGYSILDKQGGLTASEFQQQVGFQRAMEGELKKTIESIDGVTAARVQLAMPKKDVFADEEGKPTASVLVTSRPGQEMTAQQVQAVVHLVSSSVPELEPDAVTVADASGKVLSTSPESGAGAVGDLRAQQVQAYEKRVGDDVQAMLEKVVGPGNAAVTVTADLDFDQTETRSKTYDYTKNTPPLSEKSKTETLKGSGGTATGVLGPDNIQVPSGSAGGNNDYRNAESTVNNPVNETDRAVKSAPGAVRRQHIAVLLNARAAGTIDPQQVQDMIVAGTGIDAQRGDTVNVTRLAFDDSAAQAAAEALKQQQEEERRAALMAGLRTAGLVLLVLLLLVGALVAKRRRRKVTDERHRVQLEALQRQLEEIESRTVRALEPGTGGVAELEAGSPVDPEAERMGQVRDEIGELVEAQPEEVATLLRSWLADRRS